MFASILILYGFAGGLSNYLNGSPCLTPKEGLYCSSSIHKQTQVTQTLIDQLAGYQCRAERK